ncbi:uncharacterized protein Gasu_07770 [Galdieria sulphuraria]|uniref:Uncharacterized protein n=1 Tax=Galdieria sulphuraria TaxID=130081 RepID=M2W844_GALSU|nr:uncharacterized protein Gasu_07770 [Galdieria sulphuraria]EME32031.1 hypothetical protein Gasu_07770 [Galdieria sulphuraria]|eukprot:XP_005708551.1 hypothetical protein Gasu_07770 [Galdieria sulphuraria]
MFPFLVFCHVLQVILKLDQLPGFAQQYWLKTYVVSFCVAFGGSTIAHILCGKVVPWLSFPNDRLVATTFVAWWLVHCLPWFHLVSRWSLVRATIAGLAAVAKARSIMQFIDDVHKWFPIGGGVLGNVVLGTIAGCGGNLFLIVEEKWRVGSTCSVSELSRPTHNLKSAFCISLIYTVARRKRWQYGNYLSLQWEPWLPLSRVYKCICLFMFVHSWVEEYTGCVHLFGLLLSPIEQMACSLFRIRVTVDPRTTSSVATVHEVVDSTSTSSMKTTSALAYVKQYSPMKGKTS